MEFNFLFPCLLPLIPEMIRAMNYIINEGWCLYWGTARWSHVEVKTNRCCANFTFAKLNFFSPRLWKLTATADNLTA